MCRYGILLSTFLLILILIACTKTPALPPSEAPEEQTESAATTESVTLDPILAMADGWTKIEPSGATRCAHDTPFAFWTRPGSNNKLLVYFQGGGGCWDGDTCQIGSDFYDASVSANDAPDRRGGILDFDNPENRY